MKRSPFKRKPNQLKRSPMRRKSEKPRTSKGLFKDYKSEKKGLFKKKVSKTDEWNEVREELKERFANSGILSCELQFDKCIQASNFGFTWSFAHSLKRNEISSEPELRAIEIRQVVYACGVCHKVIEDIGNKERFDGKPKMKDIVISAIAQRKIQP